MVIRINDPMAYNYNILIGRITKVTGFEGAVTVKLEKNFSEDITPMESVFLEIEGRPVPFFISSVEYLGGDRLKLRFEGYDSIEKIREFTGCRLFSTTVIQVVNRAEDHQQLKGYKIFDQDGVFLGSVTEVISNPGQWLLSIISINNKEILIPFHEHFIVRIDKKKKIIVMDIPEGLTEIN